MPANINYGPSIQSGFQSNRDTFRSNTGSNWGAMGAAAGGAVISGFFDARNQATQARAQADSQQMDAKTAMYEAQIGRRRQLEDQRYMEEGAAGFRAAYRGNRPVMAPALTDPTRVQVTDPLKKK